VVITGASSGLGYEAARAIARLDSGWVVVVASHHEGRAAAAAQRIRAETGRDDAVAMQLDLASLASVRRFAEDFRGRGLPPLHAIVCNAAVEIVSGLTHTDDGYETTFAVNHLAHFLLVNLLLPELAEPGRIVFVASDTHDPAKRTGMPAPRFADAASLARGLDADDAPGRAGRRRYTTSKLCNVLTTYELARRFGAGRRITANAFDPGLMPGSGLARDYGRVQRLVWQYVLPALTVLPINVNTRRQSGRALAALVADPAFADVTGRYFQGSREIRSSEESYEEEKARELWRTSAELLGLDPDRPA
jgi:light-dependent protochlorophyllide reductase